MHTQEHPADRDDRMYQELKDRIAEERSIAQAAKEYAAAERHITRGGE